MDLLVQAKQLARYLDLRPKVIVAAGDALVDAFPDDLDTTLFDIWVFTRDGEDSGVLRPHTAVSDNGPWIVAPNPPAATCVLSALTAASADSLEPLRAWWTANAPDIGIPMPRCQDRETAVAEILRVLLKAAQDELRETAAQATAAAAQIYALRCEYEQTRVVVESLQTEMLRQRQCPQLMTVHLPPNGHVYTPPGGRGALVQPLPVSAEGMAGIDLHFPGSGLIASDAQVVVRLHALDMGRDLGAWRLRAPQLGQGWVRCWLPEVLGVASHDLEVSVEWFGTGAPISLANTGDWDEMSARLQGAGDSVNGCLALTAWAGGVPGVPLTCGQLGWTAPGDAAVEYSLNADEIGRMSLHVPPVSWKPAEWFPFQQRRDGSFMLHPLGSAATTLQLSNGCPPGVDRVTAVVKITSPNARGDVQYALAVAQDDDAGKLLDLPDVASDPRFLAFSDWHVIPRDDAPHVIVLGLAQPLAQPSHLLLATRMPPGVDHAWAWADWLDVRLRVRGLRVPAVDPAELSGQKRAA